MTQPYPRLFAPVRIGSRELRNRVVMGSMHTRLENVADSQERLCAFYAERARGGAGMIIAGGIGVNWEGRIEEDGLVMTRGSVAEHKAVVDAVHAEGALFLLQLLHAGNAAKHDQLVGISPVISPYSRRAPRVLTAAEISAVAQDFITAAEYARDAGYDGVELLGSEGYFINQLTVPKTNSRDDEWGGDIAQRARFPVEVVQGIRQRLGPDFLILYRISAIDLVAGGNTGEEIDYLARAVEAAGANALNTGVGWHESLVPTIAYPVPRGAFGFASARLKKAVRIPVIASNRINMPQMAEDLIASDAADLVSLARPMLADPEFANKAMSGRATEINTCIACNQACLDFIFVEKTATCLVNPRACHETQLPKGKTTTPQRIAVLGAGPAGMACAATAAEFGHDVTLFEADWRIGGQLHLARQIPSKAEFNELLRYLTGRLDRAGVTVRLDCTPTPEQLAPFDHVVVAAGVVPRKLLIPGEDHASVVSYIDVLAGRVVPGERVAIIGTGGIGFDVAEFLTDPAESAPDVPEFLVEWGIDPEIRGPGGIVAPAMAAGSRRITLMQRGQERPGSRLGKSTGWIHRTRLKARGVEMLSGCIYEAIDDAGLHIRVDGEPRLIAADTIVVCAGQEKNDAVVQQLAKAGIACQVIGGAKLAAELDAFRAIGEGTRLAYEL